MELFFNQFGSFAVSDIGGHLAQTTVAVKIQVNNKIGFMPGGIPGELPFKFQWEFQPADGYGQRRCVEIQNVILVHFWKQMGAGFKTGINHDFVEALCHEIPLSNKKPH